MIKKIISVGFSIAVLLACLSAPAWADTRHTTDDISLLNPYFYRMVNRADAIRPSKQSVTTFKPLSVREAKTVLGTDDDALKPLHEQAGRYFRTEAEADAADTFRFEPLEELHFKFIYSDEKEAPLASQLGAELDGYTYLSLIGGGHAVFKDWMLFSYDVRASNDGDVDDVDLFRYQLKTGFDHISVSAAKETLVTGPGVFGNLLLSDNVQPENSLIIKTETPYDWGLLGAFRWYAWHTWYDDDERYNKNPRMLGARLSLKPWDILELAFTRTALYGGSKDPAYDSLDAYWEMFTGVNENVNDNPYNSQQQASFDASLNLPFLKAVSAFSGAKIYAEYAFTDLRAFWQTEDRKNKTIFAPAGRSYLLGLFLTTGKTDLIVEGVVTHKKAYSGGGSDFKYGYTDNGTIIGHFAGNDTRGIMTELYYELNPIFHVYGGFGYLDHQGRSSGDHQTETDFFGGMVYFASDHISMGLKCAYRHFSQTDIDPSPVASTFTDPDDSNALMHLTLDYHF